MISCTGGVPQLGQPSGPMGGPAGGGTMDGWLGVGRECGRLAVGVH